MNLENIKKQIINQGFKSCEIIQGGDRIGFIKGLPKDDLAPQELSDKLEAWLDNLGPGKYSLYFKESVTAPDKNQCKLVLEYGTEQKTLGVTPVQNINWEEKEKEIEKKILQGIQQKEKEKEFKERQRDIQREKSELKTISGKFMVILEGLFEQFMLRHGDKFMGDAQLAGTPTTNNMNEKEKISKAVQIALKHLSVDELLILVGMLEDPSTKLMIKQILQRQ